MKMSMKRYLYVLLVVFTVLLCGCSNETVEDLDGIQTESTEEFVTETEIIEEEKEQKITLMMVGDNLLHMGIVKTGYMDDGSRDYSFLFESIQEHLAYADIKMINQETIFGGNELGFSGFPYFNSPTEVGDAIAEAGFNVVLHASNHTADQKISGLLHCVEFWKKHPEVLVTGMYADEAEENQDIGMLEIDGVTFAILNYTYGPNFASLESSIQGHLGMLCDWDEGSGMIDFTKLHPDVITDIQTAEQMADVVIVCPHWGSEYISTPSSYQETFAMQMVEAGADVIIGTHPHVVQPVEWVESENGNRALCYYSLGNYVSTQKEGLAMLEAMAWVTFVVQEDGVVIVEEETGVIPMVCHYTVNPTRLKQVYFLDEYNADLAAEHGIHQYGGVNFTYEDLMNWSNEILGEWVLDSYDVLHCEDE